MWKQIPNEEYHSEYRSYLSSSDLRRILRSPAHYRAPQPPPSQAMEFGTLAHEAVLEPDNWAALCRPANKVDGRTAEGKAVKAWQQQQSEKFGFRFINEDLFNQIEELARSVRASVGTTGLLSCGVAELSGFSELEGANIRVRPDYLSDEFIVDLKTTQDSRIEAFGRSVFTYGYDVQAALYLDAARAIDGKKRKFVWIAVEKESPYGVCIYEASAEVLERGRRLYKQALATYQECVTFDTWPSYSTQTQVINLPRYMENT